MRDDATPSVNNIVHASVADLGLLDNFPSSAEIELDDAHASVGRTCQPQGPGVAAAARRTDAARWSSLLSMAAAWSNRLDFGSLG